MDSQHEIIQDVKRVAAELGRVPNYTEYLNYGKFAERQFRKYFGGFGLLVIAAGLQGEKEAKIKAADVLKRDLEDELTRYHEKPSEIIRTEAPPRGKYKRTLVVGDTHFPFVSRLTLKKIYHWLRLMSDLGTPIERIIQIGDLYDMLAHTKFAASRNVYTPEQEMILGRAMAEEFWRELRLVNSAAECYQIKGNHDDRPMKRLLELYPAGELFFSTDKFFKFEGVTSILDSRQELVLDGICYLHGHKTALGLHAKHNVMPTVHGHTHRAGIIWFYHLGKLLWELDVAFVGDPSSKAMAYTPQTFHKMNHAWGYISQDGIPAIIPEYEITL